MSRGNLTLILPLVIFSYDGRYLGDMYDGSIISDSEYISDVVIYDTVKCKEYRCENYRYLQNPYVYIDRGSGSIYVVEHPEENALISRYDARVILSGRGI
mgnify:CR=1 FL=1